VIAALFRTDWRPLPRGVDEREYPNFITLDFVHEAVAFMGDEFSDTGYFAGTSHFWVPSKPSGHYTEKLVQPHGCLRIFCGDVILYRRDLIQHADFHGEWNYPSRQINDQMERLFPYMP
jgi:hypothetical protein